MIFLIKLEETKTTSIFRKVEDTSILLENGRLPQFFRKWNTDFTYLENRRQPNFFRKWKRTSNILKMEDDQINLENGGQAQTNKKLPKTI